MTKVSSIGQFKTKLYSKGNQPIDPSGFQTDASRYVKIPYYISNDRPFESNKHLTLLATRKLKDIELIGVLKGLTADLESKVTVLRPTTDYISTPKDDGYEKFSIFNPWYDVNNYLETKKLLYKKLLRDLNSVNNCGACFDSVEEKLEDQVNALASETITIVGKSPTRKPFNVGGKINPQIDMDLTCVKLPGEDEYLMILKNTYLKIEKILQWALANQSKNWYNKTIVRSYHDEMKLFVGDLSYKNYKKLQNAKTLSKRKLRNIVEYKCDRLVRHLKSKGSIFDHINFKLNSLNEAKHHDTLESITSTCSGLTYQIHEGLFKEGFISISTSKPTIEQLEKLQKEIQEPIRVTKYNFLIENHPVSHTILSTLNNSAEIFKIMGKCLKYEASQGCESCLYPLENEVEDSNSKKERAEYLKNFTLMNNGALHLNVNDAMYTRKPTFREMLKLMETGNNIEEVVEKIDLYMFELTKPCDIVDNHNVSDDESKSQQEDGLMLLLIPETARTTPGEALDVLQISHKEFDDTERCESYIKSHRLMRHLAVRRKL